MTGLTEKLKGPNLSLSFKLIMGCSIALIIALGISFYVISQRQERLIIKQVENEARVILKQVVMTRKWIADHGGVFIEKLPWVKPSQYLKDTDIVDIKGKRYVKETPATVTKGLSQYAKDKGLYWFHITSLKLTNPENAPDEFERKALPQFEKNDLKELFHIDTIDNAKYLRYISPLYVEEACLSCHTKEGYKVGDIRGAISITIPMDKTFAEIAENRKSMLIATVLTVVTLIISIFLLMKKLVLVPMKNLKASIHEFSEGKYSPDAILKTGDEFETLYSSFAEMAGSLTEYHDCLNDKIKAATKDLEETNTKLIKANRLLCESTARKSDFIAGASHELRTPLTSIKGAMDYISTKLSLFLEKKQGDEAALSDLFIFFEVIKKNSERLIRMVNDMLDIERIEMGTSEMHFTSVNLEYLIPETVTNFQVNAHEKDISFRLNLPDNLSVYADEDRIQQVLINLLSNAIKFSPSGTEITIAAYNNGNAVTTEICDIGPGITPSEHQRVFEKFYKNSNKEGAGLGLAICKTIIEAHNGTIGLRGNMQNGEKGSCFYFTLPNSEPSQQEIIEKPGDGTKPCQRKSELI